MNENPILVSLPHGGGIYNGAGSTLGLRNTIIANSPNGFDCAVSQSAVIISLGHNLDSDGTCDLTDASDMPNTDPKLGPLQDNGGSTLTHALLPGSPAIDAGDDSVVGDPLNLTTDQRGAGFPRLQGAHVDIGAFEFEATITVTCNGSIATIVGTAGDDFLTGTVGADVIAGLGGGDVILGLGGNDTICGGDGDDFISGGGGKDHLRGDNGEDVLRGGRGNDRLYGGNHNDILVGGKGNDRLYGNKGDDVLLGRAGNDKHYCAGGKDLADGGHGRKDQQSGCEMFQNIP